MYNNNTWIKRLSDAEFTIIEPLLFSGMVLFNVIDFMYSTFRKRLQPQDVFNMRLKVFSQSDLPDKYLISLSVGM